MILEDRFLFVSTSIKGIDTFNIAKYKEEESIFQELLFKLKVLQLQAKKTGSGWILSTRLGGNFQVNELLSVITQYYDFLIGKKQYPITALLELRETYRGLFN